MRLKLQRSCLAVKENRHFLATIEKDDNKICSEKKNPKRLKLVEVHVYGTNVLHTVQF